MIHLGLANGVQVYELTAGNSQYDMLRYDEIKNLTRVVVETVGGRGIVIAATGAWWTGQAVDYARYAEAVGADAVQVLLPPGSEDGYVAHFHKIASKTKLAIALQGELPIALMERLVAIPAIVTMKEDGTDQYYIDIVRKFGKRLAIFCGGQTRRYLLAQPYGSPAFFSTLSTFAPEIDRRFWQAIERGDRATASAISAQYEQPLIAFCLAGPRSFHAYWRALLEHFGVAQRFVRPPEASCTEEDMRQVAALCDRIGLKPKRL
jgi:dihydrodipicolinate synthase/N-acetylneuraminate lyase